MKLFLEISLLIILTLIKSILGSTPMPSENFPRMVILKEPDLFNLYWKHDNEDITFEIHYKNDSKWIMFGINQENSNYSDLVAGWINNNGIGHFSDRKSSNQNSLPTIDESQDWLIQDAKVLNDYRILKFTRKIKLCDTSSNDLDILTGAQNRIVFAMGGQTNDNNGAILDFESLSTYVTEIDLLSQTNGPFNCRSKEMPPQFTSKPTGQYTNQIDLVEGIFRFYWNFSSTDLIGEIHCKTDGWVGFGLSPNGGMDQSDVIVGWISNGVTNFTDRHIIGRQVLVDKNQDWKLLFSAERDGYTIFKFTRPLLLCDSEDRKIEGGSPRIIFAYGSSDPATDKDISYHGTSTRGSQAVNLITSSETKESEIPDVEILEYSISHIILPPVDTFYYANVFEIPKNLTQKRHFLKWEIVLPNLNRKNIHHLIVYECQARYNGIPVIPPGDSNKNKLLKEYCNSITHAWAIGGDTFTYYPKDTGYPVGGDTDYSYVVPELHYDNPELKIGYIEFVKIRYYMTKKLQKNELGILTLGSQTQAFSLELPPGLESIGITNYCPKSCTSKYLKDTDITVISALPHTHLAGNKVWTKIIRDGLDIGYLFYNKYYDFNYQQNYLLDSPIKISKNDELVTFCNYQTKNRTKMTHAGISTKDEMCYQYVGYYPRKANLTTCTSIPSFKEFANLMISLNNSGDAYVPQFNVNSLNETRYYFMNVMMPSQSSYSDNFKNKFVDFYKANKFHSKCNEEFDYVTEYNPIRSSNVFIEPDSCRNSVNLTTPVTLLLLIALFANLFVCQL